MAATLQHNEHTTSSKENVADMMKKEKFQEEDDEDLFEIDLDGIGNLPPPFYGESCLMVKTNTLFANCLVPVTDVSSAVPLANPKDADQTTSLGPGLPKVVWVREAEPFQSFAQMSSSGVLSNLLQKTLSA